MPGKKRMPAAVGNAKVRAMAAMMDSDSDASYGSEGGLKPPKPEPIKKRGGKKRTKK